MIDYDGILVMEKGQVESYGPPAVLLGAVSTKDDEGRNEDERRIGASSRTAMYRDVFEESTLKTSTILQEFVQQGGKLNEKTLIDLAVAAYWHGAV